MRIPSTIALIIALMLVMGCVLQTPGQNQRPHRARIRPRLRVGPRRGRIRPRLRLGPRRGRIRPRLRLGPRPALRATQHPNRRQHPPSYPPARRRVPSIPARRQWHWTRPATTLPISAPAWGNFRVELLATQTPVTVNNFVFLARQGFYNGTIFHRVIENFMIQGGDPTGIGSGNPGYRFRDEIVPGLVFDAPGKLAMANGAPIPTAASSSSRRSRRVI